MREVLRLPAYRRLLAAYALNELTWAIGSLALTVLVYRRTGSAVGAMSYFLAAQFVPALIAPAVVAHIDRRPARSTLAVLYGAEAVAYAVLAWLAGHFSLVPVLAITVVDGVIALSARSISRAATVAVTAPAGLLREGNALANAAFSACYMAGPILGGVAVATGGTAAALLVSAGLFVAIVLTLAWAPLPPAEPGERSAAGRLRAALAHARERPAVMSLLGLEAAGILAFTVAVPVEVVLAERVLHSGAGGYGALLALWGAGAVLGSALYARWRRAPEGALIAAGSGALGAGMIVMGAAPVLAVALAGAALAGVGNGIWAVAARTALQERVEVEWMALIMSLNESIFQAVPGAGILIGGGLAAIGGARLALAVAGGGALALTAALPVILAGDRGGAQTHAAADRAAG